ncbi:hypothetical protein VPNG_03083 [Cytospora leucostoma]|uniref:Uncharacterized protein n=1 Tax=Cytospora leucostoma TaxID=1230097 RepID=A0A423XH08_9PEZI|nr:hypothetical protein VPNG_03083 [Cytospora leucostoma]
MKDTGECSAAPIRIFRPKWKVHFEDGKVFPTEFLGIHLGTVGADRGSLGAGKAGETNKPFDTGWDILFIDTYVFDYCERADAIISFDVENGLPDGLDLVQNVAIDASSLSMHKHDVWYKKLRFILRNFPKVKRVTIVATVILDIASPECMLQPMYHMDIQNISTQDRMRHGMLFGEDLPLYRLCTQTSRPSDFALRAWNDLPSHWPSWRKRIENNTAPCLFMTAVVYFKREWISLEGEGGPEGSCTLGDKRVDVAGTMFRNEVKKKYMAKADLKASITPKPAVKKQASFFSLSKKKNSMLPLQIRPSMPMLKGQVASRLG